MFGRDASTAPGGATVVIGQEAAPAGEVMPDAVITSVKQAVDGEDVVELTLRAARRPSSK